MQIVVAKSDLLNSLRLVQSTVVRSANDLSGHYLFRLKPGTTDQIEILTYADRCNTTVSVKGSITPSDTANSFTFEAKRLDMWLEAVPDEAITFEHAAGTTTITCSLGSQAFGSLDPTSFPYADSLIAQAQQTATIKADSFKSLLARAKPFISVNEAKEANLCQAQFRDSYLYATDRSTAIGIKVPELASAPISVSTKSLNPLLQFLGHCGDGEISIKEHERIVCYALGDQAVFCESRNTQAKFPMLQLGFDQDSPHVWELDVKAVRKTLPFLISAAPTDDTRVLFQEIEGDDQHVNLGMRVQTGGTKYLPLAAKKESQKGAPKIPGTFKLPHEMLVRLLDAASEDTFKLGIHPKGDAGWCRLNDTHGGQNCYVVVVWKN